MRLLSNCENGQPHPAGKGFASSAADTLAAIEWIQLAFAQSGVSFLNDYHTRYKPRAPHIPLELFSYQEANKNYCHILQRPPPLEQHAMPCAMVCAMPCALPAQRRNGIAENIAKVSIRQVPAAPQSNLPAKECFRGRLSQFKRYACWTMLTAASPKQLLR